jgi:hypothetical protein
MTAFFRIQINEDTESHQNYFFCGDVLYADYADDIITEHGKR